jgi:hypothetical protein
MVIGVVPNKTTTGVIPAEWKVAKYFGSGA